MNDVKRPYASARRQAQARATRRSIVDAAGELFVQAGYGATSLQQIADRAEVAVQTIYATFGNKRAVLEELLDTAIAGDDEPVAVNDRDWMHDVFHHPDPHARLQAYAAAVAAILHRAGAVFSVLQAAVAADPDLAPLAATTEQRRRTGSAAIVSALNEMGALRADLTVAEAVDVLWTLNSPDIYQRLVHDSGWPVERYQAWLAATMQTSLLPHGAGQPPGQAEMAQRIS